MDTKKINAPIRLVRRHKRARDRHKVHQLYRLSTYRYCDTLIPDYKYLIIKHKYYRLFLASCSFGLILFNPTNL